MAKKILYFYAGAVPTSPEKTAVAAIQAVTGAAWELGVRRADLNNNYGSGKEAADYVAGTIPSAYSAVPVFDPAAIPAPPNLPANQAIVKNGLLTGITATGSGTKVSLTIANNVVTGVVLST